MIEFRCDTCGKLLRAPEDRVGQTADCPQCRGAVTVPGASAADADPWGDTPPGDADGYAVADDVGPRPCPMCGTENAAAATRCVGCGEALTPAAPADFDGTHRRRPPGVIDLGVTFSLAWERYKEQFGLTIGGSVLYGALYLTATCLLVLPLTLLLTGAVVAGGGMAPGGPGAAGGPPFAFFAMQALAGVLSGLLLTAVFAFFDGGFALLRLNIVRRRRPRIGDLFAGGRFYAVLALNGVLFFLASQAVWQLPNLLNPALFMNNNPNGPPEFGLLGAILALYAVAFVWSLVAYVLLWPFQFLAVDYGLRGTEPLRAAFRVTRGSRPACVVLVLAMVGLYLLGLLALLVGAIFTLPFCGLLMAAAYEQISGNLAAEPDAVS